MNKGDKIKDNQEKPEIEIEEEDLGEGRITNPYDPSEIRIDHQNVNLGTLLEMMEYEEIDLMPDFQREGGLWTDTQKSQLIESILLGLPLPSFYFSVDKKSGKWLVVDGLQRLTTFNQFWFTKSLKLTGLEFLAGYEGKGVDDLSRSEIRKISGFKVNLYVIDKETPEQVKFLIFKRVNTGGLILTPQEIRHALNQGIPADYVKELSQIEEFKRATDYRIPTNRQQDRDFVNRFLAFYLLGYEENYDGELDSFLNDGMAKLGEISANERFETKNVFRRTMEICFNIFGNDAFRKRYNLDDRRKPISKAVYDTVSVNIAWKTKDEKDELVSKKNIFKDGLMKLFNEDEAFHRSITTGTAQKSNVKRRFDAIKELIDNTLAQ
jgi:hypothetical protein